VTFWIYWHPVQASGKSWKTILFSNLTTFAQLWHPNINEGEALGVRQLAAALFFVPGSTIAVSQQEPLARDHSPSAICASDNEVLP
jgi:hypothetical protein